MSAAETAAEDQGILEGGETAHGHFCRAIDGAARRIGAERSKVGEIASVAPRHGLHVVRRVLEHHHARALCEWRLADDGVRVGTHRTGDDGWRGGA